jgi:hypothetical protein
MMNCSVFQFTFQYRKVRVALRQSLPALSRAVELSFAHNKITLLSPSLANTLIIIFNIGSRRFARFPIV